VTGTTGITVSNGNGVLGNPSIDISFQSGLFANTTGVYVNVASVGDGTLPILRGGTGGPDRVTGLNNLLPTQNSAVADYVLRTDGTNASWVLATGPTGFTGSRGFTGSVGSIGPTGFTGSAGTNGTNGFTGSVGAQGFTGSVGAQGGTGFTGSAGTNGSLGFTGSTGVGATGFTGSIGGLGYTGSFGVTGFTGSRGFSGSAGFTGSAGTNGGLGYTGSQPSLTAPILRNVTSGYTGGGQVFVSSTTPTASAAGDIWIQI
jgi:hypothetical protein